MNREKSPYQLIALGFAATSEVVVISLAGLLVGYGLDRWIVRTKPWLTVIFLLLGMTAGFYQLYKRILKLDEHQ